MKKQFIVLIGLLALLLMSFTSHKFYVSIYKIEFVSQKTRIEVTGRIFLDDLSNAIQKKYGKKVHLGNKEESEADVVLLKKYLTSHLRIKVNGIEMPATYVSHEYENTVFIGYFKINGVQKVQVLEIVNTALCDYIPEQQNIIQTLINGEKSSAVLTIDNPVKQFKY
jgi:hypothetical protein